MRNGSEGRVALWRAGVLDPDEALDVAERVQGSPDAPLEASGDGSAWRVPPPGFGLPLETALPEAMASEPEVPIGERFVVRVPERAACDVVVLRRDGQSWDVLAGPVALERLAKDGEGHRLDLVARGPSGRQRWAVALLPAGTELHGSTPWYGLQRAIATGKAEIGSVEIRVR